MHVVKYVCKGGRCKCTLLAKVSVLALPVCDRAQYSLLLTSYLVIPNEELCDSFGIIND